MCPSSSGVMDELVGKFLDDSTYSDFPSPPPMLSTNVTSLSGSTGDMGGVTGIYVGSARFEFIFLLLMVVCVAVLEAAVLVSVWAVWSALAQAGKAVHPALSVITVGENARASG